MPSFRAGTVTEVLAARAGLQRVLVRPDAGGEPERAYVLTALTGPVAPGDEVVVNTTAVDLGLGTGGWHVVHWNLSRRSWSEPGPGHIVKLRYTSLQADTGAAEEDHGGIPPALPGTPVVACSLHSQVPGVAVTVKHLRPDARVAYVMTDGAALPLALSDLVAAMRDAGVVDGTVTAGHAFGGDLEAVTVPSALTLAAHVLRADVVVVAMGPGVVGTGTALGTTAIEVASLIDATEALGGRPVACMRVSDSDTRARHRGVSHHTLTALRLARASATLAALPGLLDVTDVPSRHGVAVVEGGPDVAALLAERGLHVTTMGRGPDREPRFFAACGAAGAVAAGLLGRS
ncbi:MAG: DUF3866 family protein [Actinobacteria bacterium]|nr:DUF3866 family protein [Actinomycetota bacterium]